MPKIKDTQSTEIVTFHEEVFAVMDPTMDADSIKSIIASNLGNMNLTSRVLPNVTVPAGGATMWKLPTMDGPVSVEKLNGIILTTQPIRRYYSKPFDETGGNTPPDCYSPDGITGYGDPAGNCFGCEHNKFKPNKAGVNTKACSERLLIFKIMKDDILPLVVHAPVKSIANMMEYLINLTRVRKPVWSVFTELGLAPDKSTKGILYSKIIPKRIADLPAENVPRMEAYVKMIKPYLVSTIADMAKGSGIEEVPE